jgi:hypothetical protein
MRTAEDPSGPFVTGSFGNNLATAMTWRPLSKRQSPRDAEAYDALHDGVPEWLSPSVAHSIYNAIALVSQGDTDRERELLQIIERRVRLRLEWHYGCISARTASSGRSAFASTARMNKRSTSSPSC